MVMDYALIERYFDWRVEQLIMDGEWKIPIEMYKCFAKDDLPVFSNGADKKVRSGDIIGKFYVASAVQMIIDKYHVLRWAKQVWNPCIHSYELVLLKKISGKEGFILHQNVICVAMDKTIWSTG